MSDRKLVSDHLLIRWLQRVERVDVEVYRVAAERMQRPFSTDKELVEFMETYSSIDFDRIRAVVAPMVAKALVFRATNIHYNGFRIPLVDQDNFYESGSFGKSIVVKKKRRRTPDQGKNRRPSLPARFLWFDDDMVEEDAV